MFRFANPAYLYLLILIPVFIAIYILIQLRMKRQLKKFGDIRLLSSLMPDVSNIRRHVKFSLMMVAFGLLVAILARPQYGTRNEEVKRSGIEVMIAVDVSNSMYCQDVNPSRLQKAKMIVSKLIEQFDEDRVGLVAFAGTSITLLPITSDYVSAKMFLDQMSPASIANQGTNIADAIRKSVMGFSERTNIGRALILITDAEDHEQGTLEAAAEAKKQGVQIFVLSVGTESGGPIPMPNGEFKRDMNGNVVTTKLNEQVGMEIAKAGGGLYIRVDQTNNAQNMLANEIDKMQKADITSSMYSAFDEQFGAVAILLLLVIIIECCIMERQNAFFKRIILFGKRGGTVIVLLLLSSCFVFAQSTDRDYLRLGNRSFRSGQYDKATTYYLKSLARKPSFESFYNLGNSYLMQGQDSTGARHFFLADSVGTRNNIKRAWNFHNLGCIWYSQGLQRMKGNQNAAEAFQLAVDLFKSSLRCNPDDNETRYNLAMAQFMLKKNQQNQNGGGGNDKKENKEDKQEDKKEEKKEQQQQKQENKQQQQNEMSDQNAQQLLNSAQQDEKGVQRKLNQQQSNNARRNEKDW